MQGNEMLEKRATGFFSLICSRKSNCIRPLEGSDRNYYIGSTRSDQRLRLELSSSAEKSKLTSSTHLDSRTLAYEYATMGSLHDLLHGRKGVQEAEPGPVLTWNQRVKVVFEAAKGLEFLHEKCQPSIVHCDVRSSNVLLFDDFVSMLDHFNLTN